MVSDRFAARGIPRRSSIARMASARSFALVAAVAVAAMVSSVSAVSRAAGDSPAASAGSGGVAARGGRAWLGVGMAPVGPTEEGVRVQHVIRTSPAALAGINEGERIVAVGGEPVGRAARRQQQDRAPRQRRHRDPRAPHFHLLARALRPARTSPLERSARPHGSGRRLPPPSGRARPPSTAPPRRWPRFEVGSC